MFLIPYHLMFGHYCMSWLPLQFWSPVKRIIAQLNDSWILSLCPWMYIALYEWFNPRSLSINNSQHNNLVRAISSALGDEAGEGKRGEDGHGWKIEPCFVKKRYAMQRDASLHDLYCALWKLVNSFSRQALAMNSLLLVLAFTLTALYLPFI